MTRQTYSIEEIKDMLTDKVDSVAEHYAPMVKGSYIDPHGRYFTLNPGRADRNVGSFWINTRGARAGYWQDKATGDHGDIIDLIRLSLGCSMADAIKEARAYLGLQNDSPELRAKRKDAADRSRARREQMLADEKRAAIQRSRRAQALWLSAQAHIKGTPVEYYLRDQRGIDLAVLGRQPGVLRYHPQCFYQNTNQKTGEVIEARYPAMLAAVTDHKGEQVAVHRTYLGLNAQGKWDKAQIPAANGDAKKVYGDFAGAAIHLWKGIGPRGGKPVGLRHAPPGTHVYMAEGIEDALSAVMLDPSIRAIAGISLSNLGQVQLPEAVSTLTLIGDQDEHPDTRAALDHAIAAHQRGGRSVRLFLNKWGGKDLNDALRAAQQNKTKEEGGTHDELSTEPH